jgi:hypothetical protein
VTYIPAVGDRVAVHRTNRLNGQSFTFHDVITEAAADGKGPRFAWDGFGRFYLRSEEDLAKIGCVQTIELIKRAEDQS